MDDQALVVGSEGLAPALSGKQAWEQYLENHVLDGRLVRADVADSWERCRALKVNPFQQIDPSPDPATPLEERLYRNRHLIRTARPFMQDLYRFVSGSPFQVVLTDGDGVLLDVVGDKAVVSRKHEVHFCPGGTWTEAEKGTNAIGTALAEERPVQIFAWEHFCEQNHFLTCSAAPIKDPAGNVVGVIDASGDCREANPHTLGMVVAAARAIENQLRLDLARHQLYVASCYSNVLVNGMPDGLIAVDSHGIITEINPRGGEMLGITPGTAKGRPLEQVCLGERSILQAIQCGRSRENRQIIDLAGRRIRSSASPLHDETGRIVGTIAFLREVDDRTGRRSTVVGMPRHTFDDVVAESTAMRGAMDWAVLAASCNSSVLILGETGTGKEMFASAIHAASSRRRGPFVAINCAALPESLVESELFGYVDGAFTGARKGGAAGKFEAAAGGTIFLDEIGEMSLNVQAKLLRVLNDKRVSRLGSTREIEVDIRIIAATHCDLRKQVEEGRFREDLFYRLAVLEFTVPPLRERHDDLPELARSIAARITARLGWTSVETDAGFLRALEAYSWPGNVREMENAIERAIIRLGGRRVLMPEDLDFPVTAPATEAPQVPPVAEDAAGRVRPLRDVEKAAIAEALALCGGNIRKTAARLGIARNTLYHKMEEYGLTVDGGR